MNGSPDVGVSILAMSLAVASDPVCWNMASAFDAVAAVATSEVSAASATPSVTVFAVSAADLPLSTAVMLDMNWWAAEKE